MAQRPLLSTLALGFSFALGGCSWFQKDDGFPAMAPAPAAGEAPQVIPVGQTPVVPGAAAAPGTPAAGGNAFGAGGYATHAPGTAAAPAARNAPIANEQLVRHTIVSGDSLWVLARKYKTSVERISEVNGLTSDTILAGQTITIPTTSPPPGAQVVPAATTTPGAAAPAPATTTTPPTIPSALNPVVKPLPATTPSVGPRESIAIPRPAN